MVKRMGAGAVLAVIVTFVALVIVGVVIAVSGVTSAYHKQDKAASSHCLTGSKLCGADARSFCENIRAGQTVDARGVDQRTRRECAALGVRVR